MLHTYAWFTLDRMPTHVLNKTLNANVYASVFATNVIHRILNAGRYFGTDHSIRHDTKRCLIPKTEVK